jgi:hypothetical protein
MFGVAPVNIIPRCERVLAELIALPPSLKPVVCLPD